MRYILVAKGNTYMTTVFTGSKKPVVIKYIVTHPTHPEMEFNSYSDLVEALMQDPCVDEIVREDTWEHIEGCKCDGCFEELVSEQAWEWAEETARDKCSYTIHHVLKDMVKS